MGTAIFIFGLSVVMAPILLSPNSPDEYIRWLTKQPLIRYFQFRYCVISGMLIAAFGALLNAIR